MSFPVRRITLRVFVIGIVALSAAQLVQPTVSHNPGTAKNNLLADPSLNPQVRSILLRACADCHSYQTRLPWYGRISPVSWLIVRHMDRGREKLNFSEWPQNSANQKQDIADSVDKSEMPLPSYLLMHRQARLTPADRKAIARWADSQ
jgi:hypothetical protein